MAKRLLVMRHAKSDWDADFDRDHERPLNDRGVRSARLMGRYLAAHGLQPDLVVSSTAVRARTTAELAIEAGSWGTPLRLERSLYESGPDAAIQSAARTPDVGRLMMVGHQPTWGSLVASLSGHRIDMKTATVAIIDFEIDSWSQIEPGRGALAGVHQPREYFGSEWDET